MGSSKKSKDKDRDRKKRKRDRSSSRSRDHRSKHHRHHHKHKKHKRAREEHSPSISLSDLSDIENECTIQKSRVKSPDYDEPPPLNLTPPIHQQPPSPPQLASVSNGESKGRESSLSIQETNKIRAKLGLKPLQITTEVKSFENAQDLQDAESAYKPGEVLHKPAENLRDKIEVEKLREKIAAQKEKRRLKDKLVKVKRLGESDDEDNILAWVDKSRKIEKAKKEAEKRNKIIEELDAQFGVGDLVEEEMTHRKKKLYDSHNLAGLKVEHDIERFNEDRPTILTLKDSKILDGDEDTLVNVDIADAERAEANLRRRRAKPDEAEEYEAPEVDEEGRIVQKTLLTKYDEEIEGERRKSFRLGSRGQGIVPGPRLGGPTGGSVTKLRQLTSLAVPEPQLAAEYLRPGEVVTFRKVKKKKKKKKALTADDLAPLAEEEEEGSHWGSRKSRMIAADVPLDANPTTMPVGAERVKSLRELMEEDEEEREAAKEEPMDEGAAEEGEAEAEAEAIELREALARSRRAKQALHRRSKQQTSSEAAAADALQQLQEQQEEEEMEEGEGRGAAETATAAMTLNLTDEFCRSLGDIPTYGLAGNRADEDAAGPLPPASTGETGGSGGDAAWDAGGGAWEEVDIEEAKVELEGERGAPILEEEPDTGVGVVNALRLAMKKGYLEKGADKRPVNATLQHLRALHYSIEDKTMEDERRGRGGGDRYMGPSIDFKEKDTYRPDVKLEYVDDDGRKLNAKEAFRYLSHKFHGKGSGKNKLEKRMKKWHEELLMKHMSSSDTPLQTLERQREKQKQLGTAYLVLSGSKTQETLEVKK